MVVLLRVVDGPGKEIQKAVRQRLIVRDQPGKVDVVRKRLIGVQARRRRGLSGSARSASRNPCVYAEAKIHAAFEPVFAFGPADRVGVVPQRSVVALLSAIGRAGETDRRHAAAVVAAAADRGGSVADRESLSVRSASRTAELLGRLVRHFPRRPDVMPVCRGIRSGLH